ncbi:PDZ domain-containing protein [Bacillus lacus]|uniref:PDZ domain-containing protein n=1 Tax=Metabacillus lacus TaxID=1983721 RepID=A0A7X2J0X2_9BACI|nr:S1C family serine protease [Metabacillus lacus]MRX73412.1 PDZ domain-containing protein [Metabacillus lacus]
MGYYDEGSERYNRKQKGNRGGYFLAGLTGAVLGGLLIVFALPAMANLNLLPYDMRIGNNPDGGTGTEQPAGPARNVSVEVNTAVTDVVDRVSDAVVGVVNIQQAGFWNERGEAGTGSGVIYKKDGNTAFVVTNHHVIEGATQIEISLSNGKRIPAEVLGSDVLTDLAVLQVAGENIERIAEFGDSDTVRPGEPVVAIGNPLGLQFSGSVTQGIISGTERAIPVDSNGDGQVDWNAEVMQTDAAINPGNSGGALINIEGQVIGINSMKIAQSAVEGIGLSIPTNLARPIIEDLETFGEVRRPFLGVSMRSFGEVSSYHQQQTLKLPEEVTQGVVVLDVTQTSPAGEAGIQQYDVIVELGGDEVTDVIDLRKVLYNHRPGDTISAVFYRGGERQTVEVKLGTQRSQGS